nr:MAG TPA: hypothetical protein [Caudoviricetes sp.]
MIRKLAFRVGGIEQPATRGVRKQPRDLLELYFRGEYGW